MHISLPFGFVAPNAPPTCPCILFDMAVCQAGWKEPRHFGSSLPLRRAYMNLARPPQFSLVSVLSKILVYVDGFVGYVAHSPLIRSSSAGRPSMSLLKAIALDLPCVISRGSSAFEIYPQWLTIPVLLRRLVASSHAFCDHGLPALSCPTVTFEAGSGVRLKGR